MVRIAFAMLVLIAVLAPGVDAAQKQLHWSLAGAQGKVEFVLVARAHENDRAVYESAIRVLCAPGAFCKLMFWSDPAKTPHRLPMSDAEVAAKVADYTINPWTGYTHFQWNCRIVSDPDICFR